MNNTEAAKEADLLIGQIFRLANSPLRQPENVVTIQPDGTVTLPIPTERTDALDAQWMALLQECDDILAKSTESTYSDVELIDVKARLKAMATKIEAALEVQNYPSTDLN